MADSLSVLRDFHIHKKEIIQKDDLIIFGDIAFTKTAKTNYLIFGNEEGSEAKEHYTLDCLVFFLKHSDLQHPVYMKKAMNEQLTTVRRPDRQDLFSYMTGETDTTKRIDKYAPIELPVPFKRGADEEKPATRKPRVDTEKSIRDREQERRQLAAKFDKDQTATVSTEKLIKLSDAIPEDKVAVLRAKRRAQKRITIRSDVEDVADLPTVADIESDGLQEILSRERVGRTRADVTKGTKDLSARIVPIFAMIKAKEDSKKNEALKAQQSKIVMPAAKSTAAPAAYSRYDQEKFDTITVTDFGINTMSSYRGASAAKPDKGDSAKSATDATSPATPDAQRKKMSSNPIIIVPSAPSSMITMYNCLDILQDNKYIESDVKKKSGTKYEQSVYVQRKNADGTVRSAIKVIDNPNVLTGDEWERVVAVFVQGAAWQFKGWPWNGNPVEIFDKIKAFHIKYEEMPTDKNVAGWNVQLVPINRTKRHLDRAGLLKFWETLDRFVVKCKPNLRW